MFLFLGKTKDNFIEVAQFQCEGRIFCGTFNYCLSLHCNNVIGILSEET